VTTEWDTRITGLCDWTFLALAFVRSGVHDGAGFSTAKMSRAMDSSHEPLISDRDAQGGELEPELEDAASDVAVSGTGKPATARPGLFVLLLTFAAGISGLLFGCEFFPSRGSVAAVVC
jgi:hypothetical protein